MRYHLSSLSHICRIAPFQHTGYRIQIVSYDNSYIARVRHGPILIDQAVRGCQNPVWRHKASGTRGKGFQLPVYYP